MKTTTKLTVLIAAACLAVTSTAMASVLYEDTYYWVDNGAGGIDVVVNPQDPPVLAYVKIQETVYNDHQARQVLTDKWSFIHGTAAIPAASMELYAYSITNLTYGNGPFLGGGNGVSGYNIVNARNVPTLGIWGPNAANSWWNVPAGNTPFPANWEWDIDADMDGFDGDGQGIVLGDTFNSFMYAVPAGTPHGIVPAHLHTWTGAGLLEQPQSFQIDIIAGFVSGPVPEPATMSLLAFGGLALIRRRRK